MKLKLSKKQLREAAKAQRRRAGTVEHCDYLTNKNYKTVKRRRADPLITFASYLEKVVGDLRQMDEALQFLQPVNPKKVSKLFYVLATQTLDEKAIYCFK